MSDTDLIPGGASFTPYCPHEKEPRRPSPAPVVVRVPSALPKESIKDFLKGCSFKVAFDFKGGRRACRPELKITISLSSGDEILLTASDEVVLEGVVYE